MSFRSNFFSIFYNTNIRRARI